MLRSGVILSRLSVHHNNSPVHLQPLVFTFRAISQIPKLSKPKHSKVRHASAARQQKKELVEEVNSDKVSPAAAAASKAADNDLKFDEPPVLFIKKYEEFIDIKDIVVRDELSDMEKNGTLTPNSLTYEKIKFIQFFLRNGRKGVNTRNLVIRGHSASLAAASSNWAPSVVLILASTRGRHRRPWIILNRGF